jgi:hypothetical protein
VFSSISSSKWYFVLYILALMAVMVEILEFVDRDGICVDGTAETREFVVG